jgi:hypothetical protein
VSLEMRVIGNTGTFRTSADVRLAAGSRIELRAARSTGIDG